MNSTTTQKQRSRYARRVWAAATIGATIVPSAHDDHGTLCYRPVAR